MEVFFHIGVYIPLLPALLALVNWKKLNKTGRWFGVMLWLVSAFSIGGRWWTVLGHGNNLPFFHGYILVEFLLLVRVFHSILGSWFPRTTWILASAAFSVAWLLNALAGEGWWNYPSRIHALEALALLALSIAWFVKQLQQMQESNLLQVFEFWLCTGILVYYSGNLLLFLFSTFVVRQHEAVFDAIWGVHALLTIVLYLIYTIAVAWATKTHKSY